MGIPLPPSWAPWCQSLFSILFCIISYPPHSGRSWSLLLPDHVLSLSTFLSVASSLPLGMEFILPVFGLLSGLFRLLCYLTVSVGQGEFSDLLVYHIPLRASWCITLELHSLDQTIWG